MIWPVSLAILAYWIYRTSVIARAKSEVISASDREIASVAPLPRNDDEGESVIASRSEAISRNDDEGESVIASRSEAISASDREIASPRGARNDGDVYKRLFWLTVLLWAIGLSLLTVWQFFLWRDNEFSQFLLPPHNSLGYFLSYVLIRFWAPYLVSWVVGLLGFLGFWVLNKKKGGRFFYDGELYFLWTAVFLTGHPGWILYVILMAAAALVYGGYSSFEEIASPRGARNDDAVLASRSEAISSPRNDGGPARNGGIRVSFYHLWLPTAMAAILLNQWLLANWEAYLKLVL